jgi:hypothetical protein
MNVAQKVAWFNPAVIALTALVVVVRDAWLGPIGGACGFSVMALGAGSVLFYRRRPGQVVKR